MRTGEEVSLTATLLRSGRNWVVVAGILIASGYAVVAVLTHR
ncbi:MAG: hypothetical protein WBP61_17820 [Nocardioides sp.]